MSIIQDLIRGGNLIRWFDFRDGRLDDKSGISSDLLTTYNNPVISRDGIRFDEIAQQYVTHPDANDLSFGNGTTDSPFTIVWQGVINEAQTNYIITRSPSSLATGTQEYLLWLNSVNTLYWRVYDASASATLTINTNSNLKTGTPYCIIATYDGSAVVGGLNIYLNGVVAAKTEATVGTYVAMENLGGNFGIGRASSSYTDITTKSAMVINTELNATQAAQLTSELINLKREKKIRSRSRSNNYIDISNSALLAYYEFDQSSGTIPDLTGNGNDITITGTWNVAEDDIGFASYVDGTSDGYINTPSTELATLTQSGSMSLSVWIKNTNVGAVNRQVVAQAGGTGTGRSWLSINNNNLGGLEIATQLGGTWRGASVNALNNQWTHIVVNYLAAVAPATLGNLQIWVNGSQELANVAVDIDEGADGIFGITNWAAAGSDLFGWIHEMTIWGRGLLADEIAALYNKGIVHFEGRFGHIETTITSTSGYLGNTPFQVDSGSFKISHDTIAGEPVKCIECVTDGIVYASRQELGMAAGEEAAHGTWEFWFKKQGAYLTVMYIAEDIAAPGVAGQNGYNISFYDNELIRLYESSSGVQTLLSGSSAGYFALNTWYGFKLTQSSQGEITMYIKGGAFGDSYGLVSSSGAGTNPITDTTHTTSNYFVLVMDAGDKLVYSGQNSGYNFIKKQAVD